jgi:hypothetical protein
MTRVPVAVNFCDLLTDRGIRVVGKVLRALPSQLLLFA